mmetsp:Transcript_129076/g.192310  ORF Transcript_129076/g.192310 Transcript_129076/m.192310 type:complete len:202 (+) Transcript_129076:176-781(+)
MFLQVSSHAAHFFDAFIEQKALDVDPSGRVELRLLSEVQSVLYDSPYGKPALQRTPIRWMQFSLSERSLEDEQLQFWKKLRLPTSLFAEIVEVEIRRGQHFTTISTGLDPFGFRQSWTNRGQPLALIHFGHVLTPDEWALRSTRRTNLTRAKNLRARSSMAELTAEVARLSTANRELTQVVEQLGSRLEQYEPLYTPCDVL